MEIVMLGIATPLGFGSAIARQDDRDFMAERDERFGQRFDDVRQTAGLREWQSFRCDEEDLHRVVLVKGDEILVSGRFNAIEPAGGASSWGCGTFRGENLSA